MQEPILATLSGMIPWQMTLGLIIHQCWQFLVIFWCLEIAILAFYWNLQGTFCLNISELLTTWGREYNYTKQTTQNKTMRSRTPFLWAEVLHLLHKMVTGPSMREGWWLQGQDQQIWQKWTSSTIHQEEARWWYALAVTRRKRRPTWEHRYSWDRSPLSRLQENTSKYWE